MANNRNFVFLRNIFGQRKLVQEAVPEVIPSTAITHTIDLLELKEPVVILDPALVPTNVLFRPELRPNPA